MKGKPKLHILCICWNVDTEAKKTPKMNKISVRDIHIIDIIIIKIEITQSVFKFFAWNFRNLFRTEFQSILLAEFWLKLPKNLAAKFWILPGKFFLEALI